MIAPGDGPTTRAADNIGLKRPATHTTGTVGADEKIIVLLALKPGEDALGQRRQAGDGVDPGAGSHRG
ncbi:hypothetical protein [Saccharopolyspora spinosa]|uniref:hypothetical protein n=1 Tax=Saccharopolyspora spinosa TaxID=60894 RepID=UPI0002379570|nr:hypothetical protein [Saccharopolyspora spinosa]